MNLEPITQSEVKSEKEKYCTLMHIYGGAGNGNPLQYSCLENPMDRGAWQAMVHRVAESWTQLKRLNMHAPTQLYAATGYHTGKHS